jgi:hypothetical protein
LLVHKNWPGQKYTVMIIILSVYYINVYILKFFPTTNLFSRYIACTEGTACFFYISHYSATEINPFHVCSVTENTMEINHTGKLIFFIRGGIIMERIIFYMRVFFPRYSVEIIVEKINIPVCVLNTI